MPRLAIQCLNMPLLGGSLSNSSLPLLCFGEICRRYTKRRNADLSTAFARQFRAIHCLCFAKQGCAMPGFASASLIGARPGRASPLLRAAPHRIASAQLRSATGRFAAAVRCNGLRFLCVAMRGYVLLCHCDAPLRIALPLAFVANLCLCSALLRRAGHFRRDGTLCCSLPLQGRAKLSYAAAVRCQASLSIAVPYLRRPGQRIALPCPAIALHCVALPLLITALRSTALPLLCYASHPFAVARPRNAWPFRCNARPGTS